MQNAKCRMQNARPWLAVLLMALTLVASVAPLVA